MTDLETEIRDALHERAEAVPIRHATLVVRRRHWAAPVLAAALVIALVAITLVLVLVARKDTTTPPAAGTPAYVGHRWNLVAIDDEFGRIAVPTKSGAMIFFHRDDSFAVNDTVNYYTGKFRVEKDGYSTRDMGGTLAGFIGSPRSRTGRIIGAFREAMGYDRSGRRIPPYFVPVRVRGTVLTIGGGAVRATFVRTGPA
jgi:hypothetical protein